MKSRFVIFTSLSLIIAAAIVASGDLGDWYTGGTLSINTLNVTNGVTAGSVTIGTTNVVGALAGKASTGSVPSAGNPTATLTASIQNGSSANFMRADGAPALPQALSTTSSPTFAIPNFSDMLIGGQAVTRATLTHAGTVTLDCSITNRYASLTLTGNVTFATANLAAGKWYNVVITMTSTNDTPTFPAWKWLGGAPSTLTASQIGWLSIFPQSTTDATTLAAYTETQ